MSITAQRHSRTSCSRRCPRPAPGSSGQSFGGGLMTKWLYLLMVLRRIGAFVPGAPTGGGGGKPAKGTKMGILPINPSFPVAGQRVKGANSDGFFPVIGTFVPSVPDKYHKVFASIGL